MDTLNNSVERPLVEQARSADDCSCGWRNYGRDFLNKNAEAGYTFVNEMLKRARWSANGEWKALRVETLEVPVVADSGRVVDRILVAQHVDTGSVARVESRVIRWNLEHNPTEVRDSLRISLEKHGRDITIGAFELAVELGWFHEPHADHWLNQLRDQSDFIQREKKAETLPTL